MIYLYHNSLITVKSVDTNVDTNRLITLIYVKKKKNRKIVPAVTPLIRVFTSSEQGYKGCVDKRHHLSSSFLNNYGNVSKAGVQLPCP